MFPSNYFSLFRAFPQNDRVFVAMSFNERFDQRYASVIEPALRRIRVNDRRLDPYRVDARTISDSILTEILSGIATARLIFADVSTLQRVGDRAIRNGNVMYEVGIAHAIRQPEEVLLFRSDTDQVLFDVANVRLNNYSPEEDPSRARDVVAQAALEALNELDLKRNLAVQHAASSLDLDSWLLLAEAQNGNKVSHPETRTMGQALGNATRIAAIHKLLELGALQTSYLKVTPEVTKKMDGPATGLISYECTPFGSVLFNEGIHRQGLTDPEVAKLLEERIGKGGAE